MLHRYLLHGFLFKGVVPRFKDFFLGERSSMRIIFPQHFPKINNHHTRRTYIQGYLSPSSYKTQINSLNLVGSRALLATQSAINLLRQLYFPFFTLPLIRLRGVAIYAMNLLTVIQNCRVLFRKAILVHLFYQSIRYTHISFKLPVYSLIIIYNMYIGRIL